MAAQSLAVLHYQRKAGRRALALAGLCILAAAAGIVSLTVGASGQGILELFARAASDPLASDILFKLRLPRAAMALLTGFGLAVSGTVCQAILKNPLASPFTLGIASGAGFGAVAAIILLGSVGNAPIAAGAFAAALFTSLLILGVARLRDASGQTLILAGVALMYLFSALTSLMQSMATAEDLHRAVFWFFGNLSRAGWSEVCLSAVMILGPTPLMLAWSWDLNVLLHGDESAQAMGVGVNRLRILGVVLSSLMTAGAICFTGVIGFVGLVAPHMARMILGGDHRYLLPASGALGAALVAGADVVGRLVMAPRVIPIGVVTAFLGVPFFLFLLIGRRRGA